jgi:hypothetical protein
MFRRIKQVGNTTLWDGGWLGIDSNVITERETERMTSQHYVGMVGLF